MSVFIVNNLFRSTSSLMSYVSAKQSILPHLCLEFESRCNRPEYTPAGLYPGLKRPRLDYTRVYYSLGQFIPRGIQTNSNPLRPNYTPDDSNHNINSVGRYSGTEELFNFSTSY